MSIDLTFDTQMMIWGYAFGGNEWLEFTAVVAEDNGNVLANTFRNGCTPWDRDASYARSVAFFIEGEAQPTERFCLSGLSDWTKPQLHQLETKHHRWIHDGAVYQGWVAS